MAEGYVNNKELLLMSSYLVTTAAEGKKTRLVSYCELLRTECVLCSA